MSYFPSLQHFCELPPCSSRFWAVVVVVWTAWTRRFICQHLRQRVLLLLAASPKETNQPSARTDDVMRAWLNPKHILILTERTSEQTEDPKQSNFWQNERENWRTEIKLKPISISTDGQTKRGGYVFVHLFQLYFCTLLHRTQEVRDLNPITDSLACGWKPTRCNYEHYRWKLKKISSGTGGH